MVTLVAQLQVALEPRPAQVEVAVLEPHVLGGRRSRPRSGKGGVLASDRTRISRASTSTVPVGSFGLTVSAERAATSPTTASTYSPRTRSAAAWAVGRHLGPRHHLADPLAVAQVDEDDAPQVAPRGRPAHEGDGLADVRVARASRSSGCGSRSPCVSAMQLLLEVVSDACLGHVLLGSSRVMSRTLHTPVWPARRRRGWPRSARPACRPASSAT